MSKAAAAIAAATMAMSSSTGSSVRLAKSVGHDHGIVGGAVLMRCTRVSWAARQLEPKTAEVVPS